MSDLDRLYALLDAKTGIPRVRDARLELIAADRALEARYQVGTSGTLGITHPLNQLKARIVPLHPTATTSVGENALWHFYPTVWVDPIDAAVDATLPDGTLVGWWNSDLHKANLLNAAFTRWGIGIHFEDPPGVARRWYFITVFAGELRPMVKRRFRVEGGSHTAFHFTAAGAVIGSKTVPIAPAGSGASMDVRWDVPGRGPYLHVIDGGFRDHWLPETARSYLERPA